EGEVDVPGPETEVAAAGEGTAGEPQYMFATTDGHLWHTLRRADGSWQGLGDVQSQFTIPGPVRAVAAAGDGVAGETQYMFATADGQLLHTLDRAEISLLGMGHAKSNVLVPVQIKGILL